MNRLILKKNTSGGMTLLFASLVVAILLSLGIAIADIALSQIILSSAAKDSAVAFYAADTGIECILYYENNMTPAGEASYFPGKTGETGSSINCNGGSGANIVAPEPLQSTGGSRPIITTTYIVNSASGSCNTSKPSFIVTVQKQEKTTPNAYDTVIQSRGYSVCDQDNTRRVERGLQVKY